MVSWKRRPGRAERERRLERLGDDQLMQLYCDGDAEAFDALFDRYSTPVYNFARYMVGNSGGPDDILQETFLAVARNAGKYTRAGDSAPG